MVRVRTRESAEQCDWFGRRGEVGAEKMRRTWGYRVIEHRPGRKESIDGFGEKFREEDKSGEVRWQSGFTLCCQQRSNCPASPSIRQRSITRQERSSVCARRINFIFSEGENNLKKPSSFVDNIKSQQGSEICPQSQTLNIILRPVVIRSARCVLYLHIWITRFCSSSPPPASLNEGVRTGQHHQTWPSLRSLFS